MDKPLSLSELTSRLYSAATAEELCALCGEPYVLVTLDGAPARTRFQPSCPVIAIANGYPIPEIVDVAVSSETEAELVTDAVSRNPIASMVLVRLLRHNEHVDAADGLFAESLAYSALQSGAEFRSWLDSWLEQRTQRPPAPEPDEPLVLVERMGDELAVTLNRPHKRNAYSAGLRDALCDALHFLADDPSIEKAVLRGAGACFSAGGDLEEFGEAADGARAHASRVTRSAAALIHALSERIEAHLHGACIGAGIELPAFAKRVKARPDAFFQLPEVSMGLIPGAGGTASILARIGRHRLAFMALTGARVDVQTALEWGLVDEIV